VGAGRRVHLDEIVGVGDLMREREIDRERERERESERVSMREGDKTERSVRSVPKPQNLRI